MANENNKVKKVTDSFYVLGTPFFPVYLSIGDELMLIEGGTGAIADLLQDQLRELDVNPRKIRYMTLTHSHFDHIGLVPHLNDLFPDAELVGGGEISEAFNNEKVMAHFDGLDSFIAKKLDTLGEVVQTTPKNGNGNGSFKIDRIVAEGDTIDLGAGIRWKAFAIPGHSPCQMAYYEEKEGTLVVGDSTGLYFPHADAFWPGYFQSLEKYVESMTKLLVFDGNTTALSHFGVVEGSTREYLKKALNATRIYHEEMLERMKNGEELESIAKEKAQWVHTLHDYMPYDVTEQMCGLLIKRSLKIAEKKPALFEGI